MFWMWWVIIFTPIFLALLFIKAPKAVMVPVVVAGALILAFVEIKSIFSAFGSSNTFFGKGKKARRILKTGRLATATILVLSENSGGGVVTINDQPMLNLKLLINDGQNKPYEISFDTIIPRSTVPQFQPGNKFKVKIAPDDPQKVVIDNEVAAGENSSIGKKDWSEEDEKLLKEQGLDGIAKLLAVKATDKSENFEPVIKLTWEVKCAKWGTYTTESEFSVSSNIAQQLKSAIGRSYSTRIHPYKKERMLVDIEFYG